MPRVWDTTYEYVVPSAAAGGGCLNNGDFVFGQGCGFAIMRPWFPGNRGITTNGIFMDIKKYSRVTVTFAKTLLFSKKKAFDWSVRV
jgi:hypothetical protein